MLARSAATTSSRLALGQTVIHRRLRRLSTPAFPVVPKCPAPTCACAPMPSGLDIDASTPLNGLISAYAEHALVCTGRADWPSRIEEEHGGDNLAADMRELFGRGGVFSDPYHNISVLNASFPSPTPTRTPELQTNAVYLFPSFKYVPFLPRVSFDSVQALAKGWLLPERLHEAHGGLSPVHRDRLVREERYRGLLWGVRDVEEVMVLVCGHGGRDRRCGVMGPLLEREFEEKLEREGVEVLRGAVEVEEREEGVEAVGGDGDGDVKVGKPEGMTARVGLISHIGGHKFAGNVIIYLPPGIKTEGGLDHPLAGCGIWYGRVEPKHVEGMIQETVLKGNVVAELFRGGIKQNREIMRL